MAVLGVRQRGAGVERNRPSEFPLRPQPVPIGKDLYARQSAVRFGEPVVQFEGLLGRGSGIGVGLLYRHEPLQLDVQVRQSSVRHRVGRIPLDRLLEVCPALFERDSALVVEIQAFQVRVMRF